MGLPAAGVPMKASMINAESAELSTSNGKLAGTGGATAPSAGSFIKRFDDALPTPVDQIKPYAYSDFYGKSFNPPVISCNNNVLWNSTGYGYFEAQIDYGTTLGAIVIYYYVYQAPDGIAFVRNGIKYTKLTSATDGVVGPVSSNLNFVGAESQRATLKAGSPYTLTKSVWNGTSFGATGNTVSGIDAVTSNINLTTSSNQTYTLVVPKTQVNNTYGTFKIAGPSTNTAWRALAPCISALPSFTTNTVAASSTIACCTAAQNQTYYYVKNATYNVGNPGSFTIDANTSNLPEVNYFVFSDSTGATPLANGYYKINSTQALYVQNGAVDSIVTCPTCVTLTAFLHGNPSAFAADMCNQLSSQGTYYHDGSGTYPVTGDIVYVDSASNTPLNGGTGMNWPYCPSGPNPPDGWFRITGSTGTVQSQSNCP